MAVTAGIAVAREMLQNGEASAGLLSLDVCCPKSLNE